MEQQCDYIRLSMGLLNHGYIGEKNPRWADENTCIHQIAEWICRTAVIDGADIGWAGLHFWDNGYWSLKPCGMYLYDGIAGIVLFLAKYLDRHLRQIFLNIYGNCIKYNRPGGKITTVMEAADVHD